MVAGICVQTLIESIGHDGSDVIEPTLGLAGYRAFTAQECIITLYLKYRKVFASVFTELTCWMDEEHSYRLEIPASTLEELLSSTDAVLSGTINAKSHSLAWCCKSRRLLDPAGFVYPLSKMTVEEVHFPGGLE
jgi:hypothetical protein